MKILIFENILCEIYDNNTLSYYRSRLEKRNYASEKDAIDDIHHIVNHYNQQSWARLFGKHNPDEIIPAFDVIKKNKYYQLYLKKEFRIKEQKIKKTYTYITDNDLIKKQKQIYVDFYGYPYDRYFKTIEIDTNNRNIYATESTNDEKVKRIINKLKNEEELPPILLDYDGGILDGHHRWEAAKKLKIKKIPAIVLMSRDEKNAF